MRLLLLLALGSLARADPQPIPTWVAPAGADNALAEWALQSWARAAGLRFVPAPEAKARLRLYWSGRGRAGGFGEMQPIVVGKQRGAALFVNTDMALLGPEIAERARTDALYRDTIVYLTCVHEIGHGLGLSHTAEYQDIMYSFQYGGDIPAYFARYRQRLQLRSDIARSDAFSDGDREQLRHLSFH